MAQHIAVLLEILTGTHSLKLCSVLVIVALKSNMVAAPIKTKDLEIVLVSVGAIVGNDLFYVLNLNNITSAIGNPLDA